jgi:hypothetical protein
MNIAAPDQVPTIPARRRRTLAMTFVEMFVTIGIFIILLTGMFAVFIFGQRFDEIVASKIGAADVARETCQKILLDVHGCKGLLVGTNYGGTNFVATPSGTNQVGTAIRLIYSTNWTTNVIIYFYDAPSQHLCRSTQGVSGFKVVANYITNSFRFSAENHTNRVLTSVTSGMVDNEPVVDVFMEFVQYQYPLTKIGTNYMYDYYKLQFMATSRNYD